MSSHGPAADVAVPEITLGPQAESVKRIASMIGIARFFLVCRRFISPIARGFFKAISSPFSFGQVFPIGGLGILLLNNVVGGKWGVTIRRYLEACAKTMPLIAAFFLVILYVGMKDIYAWVTPANVAANEFLKHKEAYLNVPGFIIRAVICFAFGCSFFGGSTSGPTSKTQTGDPEIKDKLRNFSAPALLVFVLAGTCLHRLDPVRR